MPLKAKTQEPPKPHTCLFLRCSLSTTLVKASDSAPGSNSGLLLCCEPLLPTYSKRHASLQKNRKQTFNAAALTAEHQHSRRNMSHSSLPVGTWFKCDAISLYCRFSTRNSSSSPSRICCNSTGAELRPREEARPGAADERCAAVVLQWRA